mgnify:CR=1 FL=1
MCQWPGRYPPLNSHSIGYALICTWSFFPPIFQNIHKLQVSSFSQFSQSESNCQLFRDGRKRGEPVSIDISYSLDVLSSRPVPLSEYQHFCLPLFVFPSRMHLILKCVTELPWQCVQCRLWVAFPTFSEKWFISSTFWPMPILFSSIHPYTLDRKNLTCWLSLVRSWWTGE